MVFREFINLQILRVSTKLVSKESVKYICLWLMFLTVLSGPCVCANIKHHSKATWYVRHMTADNLIHWFYFFLFLFGSCLDLPLAGALSMRQCIHFTFDRSSARPTLTETYSDQFSSTLRTFSSGRKPEYLERTHTVTQWRQADSLKATGSQALGGTHNPFCTTATTITFANVERLLRNILFAKPNAYTSH